MTANEQVKREVLILAGYLSDDEQMASTEALTPLSRLVARMASSPSATITQIALIAVLLAEALEGGMS